MNQKLLFISRDPGGTNQLVALRDTLLGPECQIRATLFDRLKLSAAPEITVIAKDYARVIWQQNQTSYLDWPEIATEAEITNFVTRFCPDQIITSTCHVDDRTEQTVWRIARETGIKTTAFVDSGLNVSLRFTDERGAAVLPDQVSLIEGDAAGALTALGLPETAIFISGDLYQDFAKRTARGYVKDKLRREWGAGDRDFLILFPSDYVREMQALGLVFEVTEFDCLNCLLDLLKSGDISKYLKDARPPYRVVIRPHPKDAAGKYDRYPAKSSADLVIVVNNRGAGTDAVLSSGLVAGLGSFLMNEARMLGVGVLELEPIVKSRKDHKKTVS